MRLLMTPATVKLSPDGSLMAVTWAPPGPRRARDAAPEDAGPPPARAPTPTGGPGSPTGRPAPRGQAARPRRVLTVIDRWRYDGRWWDGHELHRDYFFVELEGGVRVELFVEEGDWWVARVSD
ncbi:MAG TPA: hypothetical protein VF202_11285 [Trueperaceae bacterium]